MESKLIDLAESHSQRLEAKVKSLEGRDRPVVTLKLATSLDGRIATRTGDSKWITGETSRQFTHLLRADHDAVLVGIGTAIADDPELTCRVPGFEELSPVRIVIDSQLRLSPDSKLVRSAQDVPLWLASSSEDADKAKIFESQGAEIIHVGSDQAGMVDLRDVLEKLPQKGVAHVLVEGGGQVAASLLRLGLVDLVVWFQAAKVIGGDGRASIHELGIDVLDDVPTFKKISLHECGEDWLIFLEANV